MQWTDTHADGSERTVISDIRLVDGLELWKASNGGEWSATVELSERFHDHLRQHAVPLDKRGIAHLSGNSLGPISTLCSLTAFPRLQRDVHLRWNALQARIGSNEALAFNLAQRIREVMPEVLTAYPHANVDITSHGLLLKPSQSAVLKSMVNGYRFVKGR